MSAVTLQTGIREYNGDLSQYTGMLGGLTPDIHTLRSLNPETTNRVIAVMYRGPFFLMHYLGMDEHNAYDNKSPFATYKKVLEYYNMGIQCNIGDATLATSQLQGGFAGRTIPIPTVQNAQTGQTLTFTLPELVGRPIANVHNMWVDGIADPITGLTTYHGLVAGSSVDGINRRIFTTRDSQALALDPSPAWEVAEFLIIALDRSGARVEGAVMALGCVPQSKIGNDIFNHTNTGASELQRLTVTFNCQFVQSAYVNDLAARYVRQFAVFGNSMNFNPGAGDAFFKDGATSAYGEINTPFFNDGKRPNLDAVQSGVGNAPVFAAGPQRVERDAPDTHYITTKDHSQIYTTTNSYSVAEPKSVNMEYDTAGMVNPTVGE